MRPLIKYFLVFSMVALLLGLLFGCLGAFQFLYPEFFRDLPFQKTRPLHVSAVVGWIFLCSSGCIYYFVQEASKPASFSLSLTRAHLILFVSGGIAILASYALGYFGGREYWEFNPVFSLLVITTWLFFLVNFFLVVRKSARPWPVYYWMWSTGVVFFILTFIEANLWVFPHFGDHLVRDLTVQWKAYGALVGSWNMLVYGIALYLVEKIKKDTTVGHSKLAFAMYFLGFFNLLFGWAHHIYVVPCPRYIRIVSYAVSMTELLILFKIIWNLGGTVREGARLREKLSYNFLFSSDIWVLLNLFLALVISIPAVNVYTHGTHVTVAHAMGSTIGINTFILLGAVSYIVLQTSADADALARSKQIRWGVRGLNIFLGAFWACLLAAGAAKGMHVRDANITHQQIMLDISPYLLGFAVAGAGILLSVALICVPFIRSLLKTNP